MTVPVKVKLTFFGKSHQIYSNTYHVSLKGRLNAAIFKMSPKNNSTSTRRLVMCFYSKRTQFPFIIPVPAIQCTFLFNMMETQRDALQIIQSMSAAVVAGCLY